MVLHAHVGIIQVADGEVLVKGDEEVTISDTEFPGNSITQPRFIPGQVIRVCL
jgi:hypothetical protein